MFHKLEFQRFTKLLKYSYIRTILKLCKYITDFVSKILCRKILINPSYKTTIFTNDIFNKCNIVMKEKFSLGYHKVICRIYIV